MHLHGAKTRPRATAIRKTGTFPGKSRTYYYPNRQDAALLWYHDHAMGINRLNIYAGLFGLFIDSRRAKMRLNLPEGKYEIPLVLLRPRSARDGQLSYPVSADPERALGSGSLRRS